MTNSMQSTLYIIGTGPGDPELLTVKALKAIEHCPVVIAPKASKNGRSTALSIIEQAVDLSGKQVHEVYFPMKKIKLGERPLLEVETEWRATAAKVLEMLDSGLDLAFPTLGDPAIYSTGYYLYATLLPMRPDIRVQFISGISAMSSCSATIQTPVCLGDDMLAVVPATFSEEKIKKALKEFDAVVLMKVHRVMDKICRLLVETGLAENAVYIEKAGMVDQRIITNLSSIPDNPHYFSTILVRKHRTAMLTQTR
ncbi:MAG: precorrin-2 C(20)-methyltransferase [Desulfopila sp.]